MQIIIIVSVSHYYIDNSQVTMEIYSSSPGLLGLKHIQYDTIALLWVLADAVIHHQGDSLQGELFDRTK